MACNKLLLRGFLIANKLQFTKDLIHEDNLWTFQMAPISITWPLHAR